MENTVYTKGVGFDHEWHPWAELSEEERKLWSDPMSRADLYHEWKKYHKEQIFPYRQMVLEQEKQRGVHGIF